MSKFNATPCNQLSSQNLRLKIHVQCYTCTCSLVNKCIINYVNQLDRSDSAFLITIINLT